MGIGEMKIVYSNDFLFHGQEEAPGVFHLEFFSLLSVVIEDACGIKPVSISECTDSAGRKFSRKEFFSLSGVNSPAPSYYLYDINKISQASWDYFSSFFDADTLFVASEFGLDLREKLTQLGVTYINFWFHPFKLLNDAFFLVGTNAPDIFEQLEKFKVDRAKMRLYGEYYVQLAQRKHFTDNLPIEDNSCLFVGQTYQDKSIACDGKYLTIADYPKKIDELSAKYSKIYYVPHPIAGRNDAVDTFIASHPNIKVLNGIPTYYLLASPKIKKVVALSSSVIFEAQFFGKDAEYLFRPLFIIDEEFSLNTFVSVYQDYFGIVFWQTLISAWKKDVFPAPKTVPCKGTEPLLARDSELFRDMLGLPFGYRFLGRAERIEARIETLEGQFNQVLAPQLNDHGAAIAFSRKHLEEQGAMIAILRRQLEEQGAMVAILRKSLDEAHTGLREAHAELIAANAEISAIRNSGPYKLGRLLFAIPRKLFQRFHRGIR